MVETQMLERLGDSAAITVQMAHELMPDAKQWERPSCSVSLHPNTREQYSAMVRGIRKFYQEFDLPLYECASVITYDDGRYWYGTTDFYFSAEDGARNHGRVEITVFWP